MNIDNPFADDLSSLDAVMAQLAAGQESKSIAASRAVPTLSTASAANTAIATPTTGSPFVESEGRRGRRQAMPVKDLAEIGIQPQQGQGFPATSGATMTRTTTVAKDEPMPWEIEDDPAPMTRQDVKAASRSVPPSSSPGFKLQQEGIVRGDDSHDNEDDPFGFLEAPIVATRTVATGHTGREFPAAFPIQHVKTEGERRRAEYRDLLSSLDAVEMELAQMQSTLDTLQIKTDTELTEMETKIIEKQMEFAKQEENIIAEQHAYDAYHQRRLQEVKDRTADLLKHQEEVVGDPERKRYKTLLMTLTAETEERESRIEELLQQRELLLQNHRYDEKGILIALEEEEEEEEATATTITTADDDNSDKISGGGSVKALSSTQRKMNTAVRILHQHHKERLDALTNGVVDFTHHELMEVAQETRQKREATCMQDVIARKEEFAEYMQDFLLRYRDFFRHRAEQKTRNMTTVREGLQESTLKLRLCAKKRMEARVKDVVAKLEEEARRFEQLATESFEYLRRKAAAVCDSDETAAQSQRADLESRCLMEQSVLERLQRAEVETLQEQLERLRRMGERDRSDSIAQIPDGVRTSCTAKAESFTSLVRQLESTVQQQMREQIARNKALRVEGEGHLFLSNDELAMRMAVQEKEAAVTTLLEGARKQQQELFATRQRCNELHALILTKLQEEVQTVRQQRLAQESHFASVELLRTAWGREQQELLHWGLEVPNIDDITGGALATRSSRAHIPVDTAVVNAMDFIVERSHSLVQRRTQTREQWRQLYHLMEKEYNNVLAERRETEVRWVQLVESLLHLLTEQEAVGAQKWEVAQEIARLETTKELLNHDKELFRRRRAELEEDTMHLKKELQEILSERAKQTELRQKLAQEQAAVMQRQHRPTVDSPVLQHPVSPVSNATTSTTATTTTNAVGMDGAERYSVLSHLYEMSAPHHSVNRLQDETGSDNILSSSGKQQQRRKQQQQQQRGMMRRSTLPPNTIFESPATSTYTALPFTDFVL